MPSKVYIKTFGCKANWSDSQSMESELKTSGLSSSEDPLEADLLVVNTCAVTDAAEKQAQKWIQKHLKLHPEKRIWVTGCGAEVDPQKWHQLGEKVQVFGNQDKARVSTWLKAPNQERVLGSVRAYTDFKSRHPLDREWSEPDGCFQTDVYGSIDQTARARAYLKIQEGCNVFCTYCIIPYGRGPSRSLSGKLVLGQLESLQRSNIKEVILTATNLGVYGADLGITLEEVLQKAFQKPCPRIRLTSLNPVEVSRPFLNWMESGDICPHVHLSVQSTENAILKRMKRGYGRQDLETCLNQLRHLKTPEPLFVGMDLITGFPGERDEDFEACLQFLTENPTWTRLHVFPYSERSQTPATKLPGSIPMGVRKMRARALMELSFQRLQLWYEKHFRPEKMLEGVLFDRKNKGDLCFGVTAGYARVAYPQTEEKGPPPATLRVERLITDRQKGEAYLLCQ
jgi:threonylcarbamoyladenosine tRNA methylthiotransferase MtaB